MKNKGKKYHEDPLTISKLKSERMKKAELSKFLGVIRQKVNYLVHFNMTNYKKN